MLKISKCIKSARKLNGGRSIARAGNCSFDPNCDGYVTNLHVV